MSNFKLMDDIDFRDIKIDEIRMQNEKDMEMDYKVCQDCNVSMNTNINNSYTCPQCGFIKKISTDNSEYEESFKNHNVSNKSHMPIKYIGKDSYKLQQNLRNSTSQYAPIQESYIKKILNTCNSESIDFRIPQNIIKNTINTYITIRKHSKVFRGDILRGVLGSIIHYLCKKEGIIRKPKEIAKWCSISDKDLSAGDKHIRQLENDGILKNIIIDNDNDELDEVHILSYLFRLKIDEDLINSKYLPFLTEFLLEINKKKIGKVNSRTSTKITSIIYLLCVTEKIKFDIDITIEQYMNFI
jgi:transcription initiation factor TFIIIB Brf1 subunit/transcription initiation factor TFIIB